MIRFLPITICCLLFLSAQAQEVEIIADSVKQSGDTLQAIGGRKVIPIQSYAKRFNPRKAILYAAVLPGSGQLYNKKYWKLPIVYGGFFMLTSVAIAYNNLYVKYKDQLFYLIDNPTVTNYPDDHGYTQAQLRSLIEETRRQRDFFLILDGFWYILQLVDAHVDAHLKEFDLNPQLKVSLRPTVQQSGLIGRTSGLSLTLKF